MKFKSLKNVLFISTLALMMTGCETLTILDIPASLKQKCPDLHELKSGQGKDVLPIMIDDRIKYGTCARRHEALVEIINMSSK